MAALVDVQTVKTFLGKVENGEDSLIATLIDGVSVAIESELGETVTGGAAVVDRMRGNGFPTVTTLQRIRSITSIVEDGTTLAASDYEIESPRTLTRLFDGQTANWSDGDVVVTYSPGFSTVPADIRLAATMQTAFEYRQTKSGGDRLGLTSNSPGNDGETVSYTAHNLLPEVVRIIANRKPL